MGDLGVTYDDRLKLIGKRVVDFLLVLIELFSLGVTAEERLHYIQRGKKWLNLYVEISVLFVHFRLARWLSDIQATANTHWIQWIHSTGFISMIMPRHSHIANKAVGIHNYPYILLAKLSALHEVTYKICDV